MQLKGFELIQELGRGGMASVWKARQVSLDRTVAIKILDASLAQEQADVQRFQSEAQVAAKLKHPGIVQVYDANVEQGLYYFVMEYVEGQTIGQWVRQKGFMPEKDALQIAECVGEALGYAWNKERIIHCDIKPDNVMLDADGTVKVADLGLARTIHAMRGASPEAEIMGTPSYISPEQSRGDVDLDFRADIYSLGAMLYHLVTGVMPFDGNPPAQVMDMQITGHLKNPGDLKPKLSRGICGLIEKMMWKTPDGRHASWESVVEDIRLILNRRIPKMTIGAKGESTVLASTKRAKVAGGQYQAAKEEAPPLISGLAWILGAVALLVVAIMFLASRKRDASAYAHPTAAVQTLPATGVTPAESNEAAARQFEDLAAWIRSHPDDRREAISRLLDYLSKNSQAPQAGLAQKELKRLQAEISAGAEDVMRGLAAAAAGLLSSNRYLEASQLYDGYAGPLAQATAAQRAEKAREVRASAKGFFEDELRRELKRQESLADLRERVTGALLQSGSITRAMEMVRLALLNPELALPRPDLQRLQSTLDAALKVDEKILRSFELEKGKEITVALASGATRVRIESVSGGKVSAQERRNVGSAGAGRGIVFSVSDLSARERMQRMGADDEPSVALLKGMSSWSAKMYPTARKYFEMTDPMIAGRLVAKVEAASTSAP